MTSKFEYNPPTTDPHIPDVRNCGCAACRERDELRAEVERLRAVTDAHMEGGRWVCVVELARLRVQALTDKEWIIGTHRELERLRTGIARVIQTGIPADRADAEAMLRRLRGML